MKFPDKKLFAVVMADLFLIAALPLGLFGDRVETGFGFFDLAIILILAVVIAELRLIYKITKREIKTSVAVLFVSIYILTRFPFIGLVTSIPAFFILSVIVSFLLLLYVLFLSMREKKLNVTDDGK